MANSSKLRKEIEALRNQAKARGVEKEVFTKEDLQEAKPVDSITNSYVKKDLLKTGIFVGIIVIVLFIVSIKISTLPLFSDIRNKYHISEFKY